MTRKSVTDVGIIPKLLIALVAKKPKINQGTGSSAHEKRFLVPALTIFATTKQTGTSQATRVNLTITAISTADEPPGSAAAITWAIS